MRAALPSRRRWLPAMVDLTRARMARQVLDPCCGSGTLLIEAALSAYRIAPGIRPPFCGHGMGADACASLEKGAGESREQERRETAFRAWGGDIDEEALRLARENADKAGVGGCLTAERKELKDFRPEGESGVVLCNPPYGERLLDVREAETLYREMGRVFRPKVGWSYAIISPTRNSKSCSAARRTNGGSCITGC